MKPELENFDQFKSLLDSQYLWPCPYLFKFIVSRESLTLAQTLCGNALFTLRESSTGKYVSISFSLELESSDAVLAVYQKARQIPGLIAL